MNTVAKIAIPASVVAVIGIVLAFAATAVGPASPENVTYIPKNVLTLQTGSAMLPEAEGATTCGASLEDVRHNVGFTVRTPTVLPEGYALKAVDLSPPDSLYLKYSDRPVCGGDGMKLKDGALQLTQGPLRAMTTENSGSDYIKKQIPKYEELQMDAKYIELENGMIAFGYPAGVGVSEARDENNEVVHTEQYDYAADLWVFDDKTSSVYYFKAFMPLEDLVRIAESLE
jgi:hypothetical protein